MLTFSFLPFPDLDSERLLLRRLTIEDADAVFELQSNPEVMKYVPRPLAQTKDEALEHIKMINSKIEDNTGINWVITMKGNPKMIGIIGHYKLQPDNHRAEIGYMLLPQFQGVGITTEAVRIAVNYGFKKMHLNSIEAVIDPQNIASEIVLQKNGFVKEAHILENERYDGKFLDTVIYSLLSRNFKR